MSSAGICNNSFIYHSTACDIWCTWLLRCSSISDLHTSSFSLPNSKFAHTRVLHASHNGFTTSSVINARNDGAVGTDYFGKEKEMQERLSDRQLSEAPGFLRAFATKHAPRIDLFRYNPTKFTMKRFEAWKARQHREADILSQSFILERHQVLGSDLATAHFVVFRGGKIKLVGSDKWIVHDNPRKPCPDLPDKYDKTYFVEGVDMSNTGIRFEGLDNFTHLTKLKWMSFRNCPQVDEWFVSRLSSEVGNTLEYLDLSGCTKLSEGVLSCMYRFVKLKELVLTDVATEPSFMYGCLLLEDAMPQLKVTGVKYGEFLKS